MTKTEQTSIRKAAILLLSLDKVAAAKVLGQMDKKMVEDVTLEIARLGDVEPSEKAAVLEEFCSLGESGFGYRGGIDTAQELVEQSLGKENAWALMETIRKSVQAVPFGFLARAGAENLVTFIMDEHPQTIALILSHLPPNQAAVVLAGLPGEKQTEIIRRVATMEQTRPDVIREVEKALESRLSTIVNQQFEQAGGVPAVAEMLNVIDRATERGILENLEQEDPDLVEQIRRLMFVFEDLTKLDDKSIQEVLKEVDTAQWALALKGASDELQERVFGNMSQRAASLLKDEMEYLGPVRLSDVEAAQQEVVDVVRRLEDAGSVVIGGSAEEQYIE